LGSLRPGAVPGGDGRRYEHGSHDRQTDLTGDDPVTTGKIALAHMKEFPDYYDRLRRMEQEGEQDWTARPGTGDPP
jgi:hypothetical protein